MATCFSTHSGIGEIDQLGTRGGMDSMLPAPWIIIGAGTFGMLSEQLGLIRRLIDPLVHRAKGTGRCIWRCSGREAD
jgi:NhaC family Na+:H+ antiporter